LKRLLILSIFIAAAARAEEPVAFSGFVDVAYVGNANHPSTHENFLPGTGTSAKRADELMLNLAQVQWTRATSIASPVGFTLSLVAGEGADVVHAGEPHPDTFRHLYQASLAWRVRDGLVVEAGVYPSHIGMESFASKDNWNYTRSWLGELSPYYQTGLKASYALNDRWSAQLHLLNGWQAIEGGNHKAAGTQLAYARGPLSASLNTYVDDDRTFGDIVALYRLTPKLQLGVSVDAGTREHANWRGVAAYARVKLDERDAIAMRAEEFRDPDDAISGTAQRLREATLTIEVRPREYLILKFETRYDRSTAAVFADDERHELLALASAVVTF
jgi:hypothetical protein